MSSQKQKQFKTRLHERNKNRDRYDLSALTAEVPNLINHVKPNKYGDDSIDFSNPVAVKLLNRAILSHYYGIKSWEFPDENLCPPIPGRADYIHHIADVLRESNSGRILMGDQVTCLDVGVGANCIYPIIGVTEYGWKFIGSDIDPESIDSAEHIVKSNPSLREMVIFKLQKDPKAIFTNIIDKEDRIDLSICNPPFHSSLEDAQRGTRRKIKGLSGKTVSKPILNFSGISSELIYEGGESQFLQYMILESEKFSHNCFWFSTLVSKQSHLKQSYSLLKKTKATQVKTISMGTGNKSSRILAWTFLSKKVQKDWIDNRWKSPVLKDDNNRAEHSPP